MDRQYRLRALLEKSEPVGTGTYGLRISADRLVPWRLASIPSSRYCCCSSETGTILSGSARQPETGKQSSIDICIQYTYNLVFHIQPAMNRK